MVVFSGKRVLEDCKRYPLGYWVLFAHYGQILSQEFDRVIHLDSDIIVTGNLDELIKGDFEVAAPRNNNHLGKSGGKEPIVIDGVGVDEYVNVGTHVVTGKVFWKDWAELNRSIDPEKFQYGEQGTFNKLFHSGAYDSKILDREGLPYYGLATSWNNGSGEYSSWKQIEVREGKLWLRGQEVRLLHLAGGGTPGKDNKFRADLFTDEVWEHIQGLIK
jgi:hypothetical protein